MVAEWSLSAVADGAVVAAESLGCERERRRGKERREEKKMVARQFKHLRHTNRIGVTQSHHLF
jgi:hypothetical protein